MITIRTFRGQEAIPFVKHVAALRMNIFRDFPYLYDGDLAYEARYFQRYTNAENGVIVMAFDSETTVGASTGLPLSDESPQFTLPFIEQGYDPKKIFYFGDSVLLPAYRSQRLGHQFFDERERFASTLGGFTHTAFCSVIRAMEHPKRPPDYRPLNAFWQARGYEREEHVVCKLSWKELGGTEESVHSLAVWMRPLADTK